MLCVSTVGGHAVNTRSHQSAPTSGHQQYCHVADGDMGTLRSRQSLVTRSNDGHMADGDTESQYLTWSAALLGGGGLYLVTTMVTWQMGL